MENNYFAWSFYDCIDAYKEPKNVDDWLACPKCKLKPRVWSYDNGEETACGCHENKYNHFSVSADETITQVLRRTGGFTEYDDDAHRRKWNKYCEDHKND